MRLCLVCVATVALVLTGCARTAEHGQRAASDGPGGARRDVASEGQGGPRSGLTEKAATRSTRTEGTHARDADEQMQLGEGHAYTARVGMAPDETEERRCGHLQVKRLVLHDEHVCERGKTYVIAAYLPDGNWHTFDVQLWRTTCDVTLTVGGSDDSQPTEIDGQRWLWELRPVDESVDYLWAYACSSGLALPRTVLTNATDQSYVCFRIALPWSFEDATRPRTAEEALRNSFGLRPSDADAWFSPCNSLPRANERRISRTDITPLSLAKGDDGVWTLVVEDDLTKREYTLTSADGKTDWQILGENRLKR